MIHNDYRSPELHTLTCSTRHITISPCKHNRRLISSLWRALYRLRACPLRTTKKENSPLQQFVFDIFTCCARSCRLSFCLSRISCNRLSISRVYYGKKSGLFCRENASKSVQNPTSLCRMPFASSFGLASAGRRLMTQADCD